MAGSLTVEQRRVLFHAAIDYWLGRHILTVEKLGSIPASGSILFIWALGLLWRGHLTCNEDNRRNRSPQSPPIFGLCALVFGVSFNFYLIERRSATGSCGLVAPLNSVFALVLNFNNAE